MSTKGKRWHWSKEAHDRIWSKKKRVYRKGNMMTVPKHNKIKTALQSNVFVCPYCHSLLKINK